MKYFRLYIEIVSFLFFATFPWWARFIVYNDLIIPQDNHQMEWLMFYTAYYGTLASVAMIYVTKRTLINNQKQLDEIKRQWKEEHKPEIIAYMTTHEIYFYICIKNTSRVPIHDIRVSVTHVPTKGIIPSKEYFLDKIDGASFAIEAGGIRYINTYAMTTSTPVQEDYLGLQFTYADDIIYKVDLPFKEGSIIKDRLNYKQVFSDIHNISTAIQQLDRKRN
jgi:hypothetical protein